MTPELLQIIIWPITIIVALAFLFWPKKKKQPVKKAFQSGGRMSGRTTRMIQEAIDYSWRSGSAVMILGAHKPHLEQLMTLWMEHNPRRETFIRRGTVIYVKGEDNREHLLAGFEIADRFQRMIFSEIPITAVFIDHYAREQDFQ